jgi:hypothetical protein
MLSKRSYVRLFTMVVLLTGSYIGLRADDGEPAGPADCYDNHTIQCFSGQVRDEPARQQFCNSSCSACNLGPSPWHYTYAGGPPNGPGCDWILWCLCDMPAGGG